jgi:hypothetical protein
MTVAWEDRDRTISVSSVVPEAFVEIPAEHLMPKDRTRNVLVAARVVERADSGYQPPGSTKGVFYSTGYEENVDPFFEARYHGAQGVLKLFKNLPENYSGLVVLFSEERTRRNKGAWNATTTVADPYNWCQRHWHVVRFEDGLLSCDYGPAVSKHRYYIRSGALQYNTGRPEDLRWDSAGADVWSDHKYALKNQLFSSKKAWSIAKKTGILDVEGVSPQQSIQATRIKLVGNLQLGEELQAFGDGKLLGVIIGDEVHVLDRPYRSNKNESMSITKYIKALMDNPPTEQDKNRYIFNTPEELETMLTDNLSVMLRSVSPTE